MCGLQCFGTLGTLETYQELQRLAHTLEMVAHGGRGNLSLNFSPRASRLMTRIGFHQMSPSNESASASHRTRRRIRNRANSPNQTANSEDSDEDDVDYVAEEDEEDEEENDGDYDDEEVDCSVDEDEDEDEDEHDMSLGPRSMSSGSERSESLQAPLDHDLAHATALRNAASEDSARLGKVKPFELVNTHTMLTGREFNVSKNGRFSRAECCHVAARYLPTDGPSVVEQLNSRAYIGQFSRDGTLFVAGFQVRIQIYFMGR